MQFRQYSCGLKVSLVFRTVLFWNVIFLWCSDSFEWRLWVSKRLLISIYSMCLQGVFFSHHFLGNSSQYVKLDSVVISVYLGPYLVYWNVRFIEVRSSLMSEKDYLPCSLYIWLLNNHKFYVPCSLSFSLVFSAFSKAFTMLWVTKRTQTQKRRVLWIYLYPNFSSSSFSKYVHSNNRENPL